MAKNKSVFSSVLSEAHHFLVGAVIVIVAVVVVPAFAQEVGTTTTPGTITPAVNTATPETVPLEPQAPVVLPKEKSRVPVLPELPTLDLDGEDEEALIGALSTYRDWVKKFRETKVPKSRVGFKAAKTRARQFVKSTIKVCDFEEERRANRECKKLVRGAFKASNKAKNKGQLDAILDRVVKQYFKFFEVSEENLN